MNDIESRMSTSARQFRQVVWTQISPYIGGGELVTVEAEVNDWLRVKLDTNAGIDAMQVVATATTGDVMRTMACRVQDGDHRYASFTVRYKRLETGAPTEYQKRLYAIEHPELELLSPSLTVQAYLEKGTEQFIAAGIVRTRDLITYIRDRKRGQDYQLRTAYKYVGGQRYPDSQFFAVYWSDLIDRGVDVRVVGSPDRLIGWHPTALAA